MAFLLYESLRECIVQVKVTKTRSHFRRGENSLSCSDWLYNCVQLDMNLWNLIFYIQSHFVVYNFCENDNSLPSSKDIIEIFIEIQLSDIMLDICCHLAIKLHEYQSAGRKGTHTVTFQCRLKPMSTSFNMNKTPPGRCISGNLVCDVISTCHFEWTESRSSLTTLSSDRFHFTSVLHFRPYLHL